MTMQQRIAPSAGWLYPLGLYFMGLSLLDLSVRAVPVAVSNVGWRFALQGMVFTNVGTFMLGFVIAGIAALLREHRAVLRVWSVVAVIASLSCLIGVAFYTLDAFQLRAVAVPAAKLAVTKAAITAIPAGVLAAASFLGLGVIAHRAAGASRLTEGKSVPLDAVVPRYPNVSGGVRK